MNVAGRIAMLGGGLAAGAAAGLALHGIGDRNTRAQLATIEAETATAQQQWSEWSAAAGGEFPGLELDTPADHARFAAFLQDTPPPAWLAVEHAEYTRARLDVGHDVLSQDARPMPSEGDMAGASFGVLSAIGGVGAMAAGAMGRGGSSLGTAGLIVGGGLFAGLGVASGKLGIEAIARDDTPYHGVQELRREVAAFG